jgi:hypothetical protein
MERVALRSSSGDRDALWRAGAQPQTIVVDRTAYELYLIVFRCQGCRKPSTFHENRIEMPAASDTGGSSVKVWYSQSYPAKQYRQLNGPGVPELVRSLYEEAARAESIGARRAAGVMYRATVEAICGELDVPREHNGKRQNLYDRIQELTNKNVDPAVVRDLHEARVVGNDAIHEYLEYSSEELADVAELINDAVLTAFVQPHERLAMRMARAARRGR